MRLGVLGVRAAGYASRHELLGWLLGLALLVAVLGVVDVLEAAFWLLLNVIVAVAVVGAATMVARWLRARR